MITSTQLLNYIISSFPNLSPAQITRAQLEPLKSHPAVDYDSLSYHLYLESVLGGPINGPTAQKILLNLWNKANSQTASNVSGSKSGQNAPEFADLASEFAAEQV